MKRYFIFVLIMLISIIFSCCPKSSDDLDIVKEWNPSDKYFKSALVTLHFVTETSAIAKVDTLFQSIVNTFALPITAEGCPDGVFAGASPRDAYDYAHSATITIKDKKIIAVEYDEIDKDGHGKFADENYNDEMRAGGGTPPKESYPVYKQQLLDKQSILHIDGVTGASYSNYRFRYAVMIALMKARLAGQG